MCPESLAERIAEPRPCASRAPAKVSWVLMQQRGENAFRHVIANYKIGVGRSKVFGVSLDALSEGAIVIVQLALAGEHGRQCDRTSVERILGGDSELLAGRHRFASSRRGGSAEVRDDAEYVLTLHARTGVGCAGLRVIWKIRLTQGYG